MIFEEVEELKEKLKGNEEKELEICLQKEGEDWKNV